DPGEECDDGNPTNGDGCDINCTLTRCGNGLVTAGEECDDGNLDDSDSCRNDCTRPLCGSTLCGDDGDPCTRDFCDSSLGVFVCRHVLDQENECQPQPFCGDGIIDAAKGETCDPPDPTLIPGTSPVQVVCRPDCTFCGDGQLSDG